MKPAARNMVATESKEMMTPKERASAGVMSPLGMGLFWVRVMTASISWSMAILMAAAPPDPAAMATTTMAAMRGWMSPGARRSPMSPEKTTKDMTPGLRSRI